MWSALIFIKHAFLVYFQEMPAEELLSFANLPEECPERLKKALKDCVGHSQVLDTLLKVRTVYIVNPHIIVIRNTMYRCYFPGTGRSRWRSGALQHRYRTAAERVLSVANATF